MGHKFKSCVSALVKRYPDAEVGGEVREAACLEVKRPIHKYQIRKTNTQIPNTNCCHGRCCTCAVSDINVHRARTFHTSYHPDKCLHAGRGKSWNM